MELRDYQARALDGVRRHLRAGAKSVLLVAPTGAGKGTIAAHVLRSTVDRGGRALFLVHRGEILADVGQRLVKAGVTDIGFLKAGASRGGADAPVQLASVQTLASRPDARPPADVVCWDEAHHAVASTYRAIREAYPQAVHLGLTATPQRADRSPLGDCFEQLVVAATPAELRDRGYLVPCEVRAAEPGEGLACTPLEAYQRWAPGTQAVVFCASIDESMAARASFLAAGISAVHIDGDTIAAERRMLRESLAAGTIDVVCNVFVLTEGWDAPMLSTCILARGCQAESTFLQMVGRVLRPSEGKERATLIDLRGVVWEHGLPYDEREYSLEGRGITRKSEAKLASWSCGDCFAVNPRKAEACGRCGAPRPQRITQQEIKARGVSEANEGNTIPDAFKRRVFRELCDTQRARGFKPGWVGVQFKQRFGVWPKWPLPAPVPQPIEEADCG